MLGIFIGNFLFSRWETVQCKWNINRKLRTLKEFSAVCKILINNYAVSKSRSKMTFVCLFVLFINNHVCLMDGWPSRLHIIFCTLDFGLCTLYIIIILSICPIEPMDFIDPFWSYFVSSLEHETSKNFKVNTKHFLLHQLFLCFNFGLTVTTWKPVCGDHWSVRCRI